jgi:LytTr DNA-binding domain
MKKFIIREILNKSYPFNDDLKYNAKIILFICLGILVSLLIFQPIEIVNLSIKEVFYLLAGLGISTFLILTLNLIILPSFLPNLFYNNKWKVKKEIIWNLWILLSISASDFFVYSILFGIIDIGFADIGSILLLGFIPVSILIIINQDRFYRSNLKSAEELNRKLTEIKMHKEKLIHFVSDYKKDDLSILPSSLVLIKSADNYIELYYEKNGEVKKQLIRCSLKRANEIVKESDFIIRCHRTFIVNTNFITQIEGNSQGYKLYFEQLDFPVFVSQKYINEFKERI